MNRHICGFLPGSVTCNECGASVADVFGDTVTVEQVRFLHALWTLKAGLELEAMWELSGGGGD